MSSAVTESQWRHPFENYQQNRRWTSLCALLIAIAIHFGLVVVVPTEFFKMPATYSQGEDEIELTLLPRVEPTAEELKFVEVNPDVPENEPDRQDQYSFRNQQAASESSSDVPLEAPNVDGDTDSQKITQGSLTQAPPLLPGTYSPQAKQGEKEGAGGGKAGTQAQVPIAPAQPLPKPAFIDQEPETEEGPGSRLDDSGEVLEFAEAIDPNAPINVYQPPQQTQPIPQAQPGDGSGGTPDARPMPRERPRLDPNLIRGPLMQSRGTTRLRGTLAIDATFSEFGEYQQQFYAALQTGWYQEIEFYQPIDTAASVHVQLTIQSDGAVKDVEVLRSTASEIATIICENAIVKRSPYRPWTREMVKVFGNERTLRVAFHYR